MSKEFLKKLEALAKEYGYEVQHNCAYCGRSKESLSLEELAFFLTFIKKD
jgi:hypothetical protein